MRVALINPWFITENSIGGTERFVEDLAISFTNKGCQVDVYMLSGNSYQKNNINYISLDLFGKGIIVDEYMLMDRFGSLDNKDVYTNIAKSMEELIDIDKYDFIQLNSHFFLKLFSGKKRVFTIHSNLEEFKVLWNDYEFNIMVDVMKEEVNNNMIYVCPSSYYRDEWAQLLDTDVKCIPHAINKERLVCNSDVNELISKYGLNSDKIKVLLPSRLEMIQKQPKLILEALSLLDNESRSKFQIIFTGIDEQYSKNIDELDSYSKEYNIDSKFIVFDSIKEAYKLTDVVLIPSKSESFGYSCLEGVYEGIVTIINNIPSLKEITKDIAYVYTFNRDSNSLKKVLLEVLHENFERRNISNEWLSNYDLITFSDRYIECVYGTV